MHTYKTVSLEDFSSCDFRLVNIGLNVSSASLTRTINRSRPDYYLFYLVSGQVMVDFNSKNPQILKTGDFYLYYPNEEQNYHIDGNFKTKLLWVHFFGKEVDELLKVLNLNKGKINVKPTSTASQIFSKLLKENLSKNLAYETMSKGLLFNLLITLARDKVQSREETAPSKETSSKVMKIISLINQNPRISNAELAESVNLSTDHFVRVFKRIFKMTPHKYKLDIIINSA